MKDILRKNDGTPFPKEINARSRAVRNKLKNFQIVPVDGGFEIHTDNVKLSDDEVSNLELEPTIPANSATDKQEPQIPVKHAVKKSWVRTGKLDVPARYRKAGFVQRFMKEDKPGRIRQAEGETWQVCQPVYKINEMILMEIPEENAKARSKYYSDKANRAHSQNIQNTENSLRSIDERISTYQTN